MIQSNAGFLHVPGWGHEYRNRDIGIIHVVSTEVFAKFASEVVVAVRSLETVAVLLSRLQGSLHQTDKSAEEVFWLWFRVNFSRLEVRMWHSSGVGRVAEGEA